MSSLNTENIDEIIKLINGEEIGCLNSGECKYDENFDDKEQRKKPFYKIDSNSEDLELEKSVTKMATNLELIWNCKMTVTLRIWNWKSL